MMTRDDLQLLTSCCSRSDIRTDICSLRLFQCTFHYYFFCLPSSLYPKGSVLFFLPANVPHKSRGERFPPPTSLNLKPTRAPRRRCCLNFTLRLDFHPSRAGLVYTGCGVREITVCVCASAGLGFSGAATGKLKADSLEGPGCRSARLCPPLLQTSGSLIEDRDDRTDAGSDV